MNPVLQIFFFNIIPLFLMILAGVFLGRHFEMDINTLTKINFYVTVPSFTFTRLYKAEISSDQLIILAFALLLLFGQALGSDWVSRLRGHDKSMRKAFQNAVMFFNSGNIGVPLTTLVFSTGIYRVNGQTPWLDLALLTQLVVMVLQNVATNTIGHFNASSANGGAKVAWCKVFSMPTIYVVPLALLLKLVPLDFTQVFFWPALEYGANALIAISLLSLGVQLTRTEFRFDNVDSWLAVALRLLGGPLLALILLKLLGIGGIQARALFIASAVPTAINTALIAVDSNNRPDFASQVVLLSTLLCGVTLTVVIWLATVFFPI